jgi:P63C domain.
MNTSGAPPSGRSRGGTARARSLSAEERSGIAKQAALARWTEELPDAICGSPERPLVIGGIPLEAYVLENGTRVLSQGGFLKALGRHPKANVRRAGGEERFPAILQGKSIAPFISEEVLEKSRPIRFRTPSGNKASGYRAELLPLVCEVYLQARDAGALPSNQVHVAKQAEILVRGFAHVGIIALVDEATGYQDIRARDALSRILEAFVAKELQAWVSTFPDDYYRQLFRLRKLEFPRDSVHRPQYFGHLTNDIVYKRLAPGVLDELRKLTERSDSGRPRHKYFQLLTSNLGYPKLREHLGGVVAIMKLSKDWGDFNMKLDQLYPRYGDTLPLPLDWGEDTGEGL